MKVILAMLLFLSTASVLAGVWMDDFEDGELGKDWTIGKWCANEPEPDWKVEDGILKGFCPQWNAMMLFLPEYPSLDYTIQVKCRVDEVLQIPEFACAGLIFRSTGPVAGNECIGPFYGWWIGSSLCGFMLYNGSIWDTIGNVQQIHTFDEWYTVKLVAQGDKFTGYVDDKPLWKLTDDKYKGKFVGLWLGYNINASFDDFMISERTDDEAFTDFDVSPAGRLAAAWGYIKAK